MDIDKSKNGLLNGKTALITGAGAGFGAAIALRFAHEGANVVIADINLKKAQSVADTIGSKAKAVQADVTRQDDTQTMVKTSLDTFGGIDIFVANAGFAHQQANLTDIDEDTFDLVFAVNAKALYYAIRAVVPIMEQAGNGGSIITLGATSVNRPHEGFAWFTAAKGWVMSATRAIALELAPKNVRVNCVCPAEADTGTFETLYGSQALEKLKQRADTIPLGRLSSPRDVANAALWLASDESAFTTGAFLPVDGGYHI